jgi:hypothetical protein
MTQNETAKDSLAVSSKAALKSTAPSNVQSATTLDQGQFRELSATVSVISESRTVAFSSHEALAFPPAPGFAQRRKYDKFRRDEVLKMSGPEGIKHQQMKNTVSSEPDWQRLGEVTCPYCLQTLTLQEVLDEKKWQ